MNNRHICLRFSNKRRLANSSWRHKNLVWIFTLRRCILKLRMFQNSWWLLLLTHFWQKTVRLRIWNPHHLLFNRIWHILFAESFMAVKHFRWDTFLAKLTLNLYFLLNSANFLRYHIPFLFIFFLALLSILFLNYICRGASFSWQRL